MVINPKDYMKYSNVVSCKYQFHYEKIKDVHGEFINKVLENKLEPVGLGFYSILNVPEEEVIIGEFFIQVNKEMPSELNGLKFHSYFCVEDMLSICVYENFELNTEYCVGSLLQYMEEYKMKQASPIYYVLGGDKDFSYTFLKVAVDRKVNNSSYFE
ncbi:MAG: DUF5085 family protein [Clostridium sp.]